MKPERLITIVRQDLIPGLQIAQTCHAVADFGLQFYNRFVEWNLNGNYIICLGVDNEEQLHIIHNEIEKAGLKNVCFYEPDIDECTAICIEPSDLTDELTKHLPLAGK